MHQGSGNAEQTGVERRASLQHLIPPNVRRPRLLHLRDDVPGIGTIFEVGMVRHGVFEFLLLGLLQLHEGRVLQAGQAPITCLSAIGDAEEKILGLSFIFLATTAVNGEHDFEAIEPLHDEGIADVSQIFEFRHGVEVVRVARVAGHEDEFVFLRAVFTPLQVMLNFRRLAVLVNTEEAAIEVLPRVSKVVRVAAVKGDLLFRGEDETNVGVAFEAVEVILAALVERDHVAAKAGRFFRVGFDLGDHAAASLERLLGLHLGLHDGLAIRN